LFTENIQINNEMQIINNMGIAFEILQGKDDFKEKVKHSLLQNNPVFVPIDRYYYATGSELGYYKKKHWAHYFLIY
jgi:hypothetical protein